MKLLASLLFVLLGHQAIAQDALIKKDIVDIGFIGRERPYKIQVITLTNINSNKKTKAVQIEYYNLGDNNFFSQFSYIDAGEMPTLLKSIDAIKNTIREKPKTQSELHYMSKKGFGISAISANNSWNISMQADINNSLSAENIDADELNDLYSIFQKAKLKLK